MGFRVIDPITSASSGTRSPARGFAVTIVLRIGLGHDQRIAQALDRDRQPLALLLDLALGARELVAHRVEGLTELAAAPAARGTYAALELAGSEARVASTSASSGRRIECTSAAISASAPARAAMPVPTMSAIAWWDCAWARLLAWRSSACWRV